jgi:diadenosine tetraphosphate (Ap4A) HIT family hydrolase
MCDCAICEIVKGIVPSWIVFQDAHVVCFLPKTMDAYGHTVIAPKAHYPDLYTAPETLLKYLVVTAKKLAVHYRDQIGSTGVSATRSLETIPGSIVANGLGKSGEVCAITQAHCLCYPTEL